jgi:spore maturation protein CgeB
MVIQKNDFSGIKLLFVYKNNSQDPTQKSLINWLPRFLSGFQTFCFNPQERKRFDPENMKVSDRFIETVTNLKPTHIFMWLVYLNPEEIEWCKARGIKMVAAINGFASFSTGLFKSRDLYIKSLQLLDIFFLPHEPHIKKMRSLGINAYELPFSFDPSTFRRLPLLRCTHFNLNKFFFVGNFGDGSEQSQYRIDMLKQVARSGKLLTVSDIKITHENIRHCKPIPYETILNILANLSKYLVCSDFFPNLNEYNGLNESSVLDYDDEYRYAIRPRIYTMIGAGSPVIIERHHQLQRFFEDEKHLIMWSDYNELVDKLEYYDNHTAEYRKISNQAISFVNKFHTTEKRIQEIILPALIRN